MGHNRLYAIGEKTYEMGLNKYSDLTESEYASLRGTHVPGNNNDGIEFNRTTAAAVRYIGANSVVLPQSINWDEMGAVTEIKDQGKESVFQFCFFLFCARAALFLFDINAHVWGFFFVFFFYSLASFAKVCAALVGLSPQLAR